MHTSVLLSLPSEICPLLNVWPAVALLHREAARGAEENSEQEKRGGKVSVIIVFRGLRSYFYLRRNLSFLLKLLTEKKITSYQIKTI